MHIDDTDCVALASEICTGDASSEGASELRRFLVRVAKTTSGLFGERGNRMHSSGDDVRMAG